MKLKWLKATVEQCGQYNLPSQKDPYIAFYGTNISCTVAFRSHEGDWFAYCSITEADGTIIKKAFRSNPADAKRFCENAVNGYLARDIWQQELRQIIENGCTDSDIEDFEDAHPEINGEDIWQFVYELDIPETCKGCVSVGWYPNFSPCNKCVRCAPAKDCYEPREDYIGSNKADNETVIKLRKALDILEEYRGYMPRDISHQIWKDLTEVLRTQIPKKPVPFHYRYIYNDKEEEQILFRCPTCDKNNNVGFWDSFVGIGQRRCNRCDTLLDWSGKENE